MNTHELLKRTNDIIKDSRHCTVGSITNERYPHVSTRSFCKHASLLTSYISTNYSGNLAQRIGENNKASICVSNEKDNITMVGTAKIITDKQIKKEMWLDWFINHYPKGIEDPEYCLIEFTTISLSLWVNRQSLNINVEDFIKPQSRCGLLCSTCSFKSSHKCEGCIALSGKPFWGECALAKCCQDKGFEHCGECPDIPCDMLKEFSCGDGEHCDSPKGSRIDILKLWHTASTK